jgi:hypothetical protein
MVRIESIDDGGDHATGLFEKDFMQDARPESDSAH